LTTWLADAPEGATGTAVHGFRFAVAAWNRGAPDAGTAKVSYSSFASSSLTAFANPKRNCSKVSGTARWRFRVVQDRAC
jgi:hypothetical protein